MSSGPYRLGLKVITRLVRDMPKDFVIEAKTRNECYRMLKVYARSLPASQELLCYDIGLRPDKDVPVARYFVEVHKANRGTPGEKWLWTTVIAGGRGLS